MPIVGPEKETSNEKKHRLKESLRRGSTYLGLLLPSRSTTCCSP